MRPPSGRGLCAEIPAGTEALYHFSRTDARTARTATARRQSRSPSSSRNRSLDISAFARFWPPPARGAHVPGAGIATGFGNTKFFGADDFIISAALPDLNSSIRPKGRFSGNSSHIPHTSASSRSGDFLAKEPRTQLIFQFRKVPTVMN